MHRVLIAPDKFKGTLTARAAAEAIARGWRSMRPRDRIRILPVSDGGDGFGGELAAMVGAKEQRIETVDAAHRPCVGSWWWESKERLAIIESAMVVGLAMLPPKQHHPFELDTFGLGGMIRAAATKKAARCILGIGGSATNDGGFGLARSLGWTFRAEDGTEIKEWTRLNRLARLEPPRRRRWFRELVVAVDVKNPLLGRWGATRIYGPQKGIRSQDVARSEVCLRQLARVVRERFGVDVAAEAGAGAAGGLGFGLRAFAGARLEPGFDLYARYARLDEEMSTASLVITGEGGIDESTAMGKGVGRVADHCRDLGIRCLALGGNVKRTRKLERLFERLYALTDLTSITQAKAEPAVWLERLARKAAGELD